MAVKGRPNWFPIGLKDCSIGGNLALSNRGNLLLQWPVICGDSSSVKFPRIGDYNYGLVAQCSAINQTGVSPSLRLWESHRRGYGRNVRAGRMERSVTVSPKWKLSYQEREGRPIRLGK